MFQESKGTISYVETLNRAKARIALAGGYSERAEALHRAEVEQGNTRALQAAQQEAIYLEQQRQQRRAAAEAEYQARRLAEEQRIQARRAADEASYQARRAEREASYASRSYGTASASNYETAPYRHAVPEAPEPRQFRDYQGNSYTQPSGSNFATETRTGQQCFVNGDFVHCNEFQRAWNDPTSKSLEVQEAISADRLIDQVEVAYASGGAGLSPNSSISSCRARCVTWLFANTSRS